MRVPEEAKLGLLASQAGSGRQLVEYVSPSLRCVEVGVDQSEPLELQDIRKALQPLTVILGELLPRPLHSFNGSWSESIERKVRSAVFVVVAFDARGFHRTDDVDTRLRVCAIADKIAKEGMPITSASLRVLEDRFKGLKIRMNVGYDRKLHITG
jgi:hypothetical protein